MSQEFPRDKARQKRHRRVRAHVAGTPARPRLNVFRSLRHMAVQIIDDTCGRTLVSASTNEPEVRAQLSGLPKVEQARRIGALLAERAKTAGVTQVVFDRGGYRYHGRVKALAEASREGGLEF